MNISARDRITGCLLGGAIGDALGAGIEFDSLSTIRRRGPQGVTGYVPVYGGVGRITDDTQMTLFTAEGLLCAAAERDDEIEQIRLAYLRWLATQERHAGPTGGPAGGWLHTVEALGHRRAPGNTCLSALRAGGYGTPDAPLNDSKGCGGVMRVAPIGLVSRDPFTTAARAAALTHGHASGYLSAGTFAAIISAVVAGVDLDAAIAAAMAQLPAWPGAAETVVAVTAAVALAAEGVTPTPERLEALGGGWVGEEALAIALYCALVCDDPRAALLLAVNHSGDSDSTGALVGNLLGAMYGTAALPPDYLAGVELREVIETVAGDLADVFVDGRPPPQRYSPEAGSNSSDTEFMQ